MKDYGVLLINSISLENLDVNQIKTILHHELLHLNLTPSKNILSHTKQSWKKFVKLSKKIEEAYPRYKMQESIVPEIFLPENKESVEIPEKSIFFGNKFTHAGFLFLYINSHFLWWQLPL